MLLLVTYISGYIAYRQFGPVVLHRPRGGGPPALLINVETREFKFLADFFMPCIAIENFCRSTKP